MLCLMAHINIIAVLYINCSADVLVVYVPYYIYCCHDVFRLFLTSHINSCNGVISCKKITRKCPLVPETFWGGDWGNAAPSCAYRQVWYYPKPLVAPEHQAWVVVVMIENRCNLKVRYDNTIWCQSWAADADIRCVAYCFDFVSFALPHNLTSQTLSSFCTFFIFPLFDVASCLA